jgi:hypothetical protein
LTGADGPYRGKLLTDGLELYDIVAAQLKLVHLGCLQQYLESRFILAKGTLRLH